MDDVEAALRRTAFAIEADDADSCRQAMARCQMAIKEIVENEDLWGKLARSDGLVSTSDGRRPSTLLIDVLTDAMIRTGYRPSPEATQLIRDAENLSREAQDSNLPRATRTELAQACRVRLIELHNLLYRATSASAADRPQIPDPNALLLRTRPPLVGMVAVEEILRQAQDGRYTVVLQALDTSLRLVVKWLSCLEVAPPPAATTP